MQCLRHTYAKQVCHGLSKIYIWLGGNCFVCLFLLYAQSVTPRCAEQYIDSHCGQCAHPHSVLHLWDAWGEWAELDRLQLSHQEREDAPSSHQHNRPTQQWPLPPAPSLCLLLHLPCGSQITWLHSHEAILLWQMKKLRPRETKWLE